jgi:hypothetical protein
VKGFRFGFKLFLVSKPHSSKQNPCNPNYDAQTLVALNLFKFC